MTAPDLKPCQFCGNDDIQDWGESTWSRPVKWMYCTECHAQGPRVMLERNESEDAWQQRIIAAWNTRATPAPAVMTPEVRALVEAAQEYINELEWHYGGGETDLGRKYRIALAALRAGGDA